jgi:hypothetical protein
MLGPSRCSLSPYPPVSVSPCLRVSLSPVLRFPVSPALRLRSELPAAICRLPATLHAMRHALCALRFDQLTNSKEGGVVRAVRRGCRWESGSRGGASPGGVDYLRGG